jgi:hypothetical protein
MDRHRGAVLALLTAATLGGCHPAAAPANASPPPANAAAAPAAPQAARAPVSDAADAAGAKAFLEGVYAHYKSSKNNNFQPFDANARQVLDPEMVALLAADRKALKGDVGVMDSDWLCDCQDFVSLQATVAVQSAAPTTAEATADFHDPGMSDDKPRRDSFDLVKLGDGWRIHDIHTADTPSLRKALTDEIKNPSGEAASNANQARP